MILLYIYLGTCIFSLIGFVCCTLDCFMWARANGIRTRKESSLLSALIRLVILSSLPIINVILGFMLLFSETLKQEIKRNLKEKNIA